MQFLLIFKKLIKFSKHYKLKINLQIYLINRFTSFVQLNGFSNQKIIWVKLRAF